MAERPDMPDGGRRGKLLRHADWASPESFWRGRVFGKDNDTGVSVLFFSSEKVGAGPPLHVHPYDEIFIVREGRARYTVGSDTFEAEAGDIVFGPAHIPHKFVNLGPGRLESTDIHLSPEWIQTDLETPDEPGAKDA